MTRLAALRASFLLTTIACGSTPESGWATIDGVGVLGVHDSEGAYFCGTGEAVGQSRWLAGGKGSLSDPDELWTLSIDDDGVYTLLHDNADEWSGSLTPFEEGGVYEAEAADCRSGAVLHDGSLTGAFCDGLGTHVQVEPVDTVVGGPSRIQVRLATDADFTFDLRRLP